MTLLASSWFRRLLLSVLVVVLGAQVLSAASLRTGTELPAPVRTVLDGLGAPVTTAPPPPRDGWAPLATDDAGRPAAWDPCEVVRWQINLTNAPDGALDVALEAFDRAGELTGLQFAFAGTTEVLPQDDWSDVARRDGAPITIAWATPATSTVLHDDEAAATISVWKDTEDGRLAIHSAALVVNTLTTSGLAAGFEDNTDLGPLLLHEIGHALGLAHIEDPASLMDAGAEHRPFSLSDGDRAGFAAVGGRCG